MGRKSRACVFPLSMRCRVCLEDGGKLYSRCECGDVSWFHDECLVRWMRASRGGVHCEICQTPYRGVEERRRAITLSPTAIGWVVFDLGSSSASIGFLWWQGYCGLWGVFFLFWWAACFAAERAMARQRECTDEITMYLRGFRLRPSS